MHQGMHHDAVKSQISKTKYKSLKASLKTNDPSKPIHKTITMELDGWMDRYIWFINGVSEHHAQPIVIEPDKRYRFIFKNLSMMHHPMHIHGHWFIVRNNHDEYDPLLHTIDMPPGATIIADVDADASGQWLFHCHFLYHMMSGMARVFQYSTLLEIVDDKYLPENIIEKTSFHNRPIVRVDAVRPIDPVLVQHPMAHEHKMSFSNNLSLGDDPFHNVQRLSYEALYGYDYNKLNIFINDAEMKKGKVESLDVDAFYWRLISQFWALKAGINYTYRPADTPYWQPGIGVEGMTSYFIDTDIRAYYDEGSFKLDIECERETQITNNFFIGTGIRAILASKTVEEHEIGDGFNQLRLMVFPFYRVKPGFNLVLEYEFEKSYEKLKSIKQQHGDSTQEHTVTFGAQFLF